MYEAFFKASLEHPNAFKYAFEKHNWNELEKVLMADAENEFGFIDCIYSKLHSDNEQRLITSLSTVRGAVDELKKVYGNEIVIMYIELHTNAYGRPKEFLFGYGTAN